MSDDFEELPPHEQLMSSIYKKILAGNVEGVKEELDKGIDINSVVFYSTMLFKAIEYRKLPIIKLLLSYGADPNKAIKTPTTRRNNINILNTPLSVALMHPRNEDVIELLLRSGANPNVKYINDMPLSYEIIQIRPEYLPLFLKYNMRIDNKMFKSFPGLEEMYKRAMRSIRNTSLKSDFDAIRRNTYTTERLLSVPSLTLLPEELQREALLFDKDRFDTHPKPVYDVILSPEKRRYSRHARKLQNRASRRRKSK